MAWRTQTASLVTGNGTKITVSSYTEVMLQLLIPDMDGPGHSRQPSVRMTAAEARVIAERLEQAARRLEREQANKSVGTSDR